MATAISVEEFERLQSQLLELRNENYELGESLKKAGSNDSGLLKAAGLPSLGKMLPRGLSLKGREREEELEKEVKRLTELMATQEQQFHLQQETLMGELGKVIRHSESLEARLAASHLDSAFDGDDIGVKTPTPLPPPVPDDSRLKELEQENTELLERVTATEAAKFAAEKERLRMADDLESALVSSRAAQTAAQASNSSRDQEAEGLRAELAAGQARMAELEKALRELDGRAQELLAEKGTAQESVKSLRSDVSGLNEKYRRKQEAYVQLSQEKESQYAEFKKRLDAVVEKKDGEAELLHKQIAQMRGDLKVLDAFGEEREGWAAERASLEATLSEAKSEVAGLRAAKEALEIRVSETASAGDVLSQQLENARRDVEAIQLTARAAEEAAAQRKSLVDEMKTVLEQSKSDAAVAMTEAQNAHAAEILQIEQRLQNAEVLSSPTPCHELSGGHAVSHVQKAGGKAEELADELDKVRLQLGDKEREIAELGVAVSDLKV